MEIFVIIVLVIILIALRGNLKKYSEKHELDICPMCNRKMVMGPTARYSCPHCGYKQGHKYF